MWQHMSKSLRRCLLSYLAICSLLLFIHFKIPKCILRARHGSRDTEVNNAKKNPHSLHSLHFHETDIQVSKGDHQSVGESG